MMLHLRSGGSTTLAVTRNGLGRGGEAIIMRFWSANRWSVLLTSRNLMTSSNPILPQGFRQFDWNDFLQPVVCRNDLQTDFLSYHGHLIRHQLEVVDATLFFRYQRRPYTGGPVGIELQNR